MIDIILRGQCKSGLQPMPGQGPFFNVLRRYRLQFDGKLHKFEIFYSRSITVEILLPMTNFKKEMIYFVVIREKGKN